MATGSEPDVWKWIAAVEATILTTLLLGAIPALFWVFRTPSNSEVQIIRDRQQIVLQRLATDDEQISALQVENQLFRVKLDEIEVLLRTPRR